MSRMELQNCGDPASEELMPSQKGDPAVIDAGAAPGARELYLVSYNESKCYTTFLRIICAQVRPESGNCEGSGSHCATHPRLHVIICARLSSASWIWAMRVGISQLRILFNVHEITCVYMKKRVEA